MTETSCGELTPIDVFNGVSGLCHRPAGHDVYHGSTVDQKNSRSTSSAPETVADLFTDVEMHEAELGDMVVKWTEPDDQDHREIRVRQIRSR